MENLIRLFERLFLIMLSVGVIIRIAPHVPAQPQLLLFLFSELVGVVLILCQRRGEWTAEPLPVLIAFAGTATSLLVVPTGAALLSPAVATLLIFTGGTIALGAKLSLGRSFGIVPANRGVKRIGVYRLVRHPMYLGYMLNHLGFLVMFCSAWNVLVYALTWTLLWLRTREEERFLRQDPAYRAYAGQVRYRLIPGLL